MINEDFHIAGIWQFGDREVEEGGDVLNRSWSEIFQGEYAEFVGAKCLTISTRRFFKGNMLSLSEPNALLFLQLLIALVTISAVKVSAISVGFLLVSLVTKRVSLEEKCMPSFEVLNCLLNLAASCLDDENEIPLKEIASFSAVCFALPSIPLIVPHSLVFYYPDNLLFISAGFILQVSSQRLN